MKQYFENETTSSYSIGNTVIPANQDNRHYRLMLSEVVAGTAEIVPYTQVVTVPSVVSMRQARLALLQAGLLTAVETALVNLPETTPEEALFKEAAKIEWEYSQTVERNNTVFQALVSSIGMSTAQTDSLFTLADSL